MQTYVSLTFRFRQLLGYFKEGEETLPEAQREPYIARCLKCIEKHHDRYPGKKIKSVRDKKLPKLIKQYGEEQIIRCIDRYFEECKGKDKQYILNESTFWNGRYMDYLDENYKSEEKPKRRLIDEII